MLKNSFSPRLLKKVQMQGGVTHPSDGYPGPSEAYFAVRRNECPSAPTPQMGLFQQPASLPFPPFSRWLFTTLLSDAMN